MDTEGSEWLVEDDSEDRLSCFLRSLGMSKGRPCSSCSTSGSCGSEDWLADDDSEEAAAEARSLRRSLGMSKGRSSGPAPPLPALPALPASTDVALPDVVASCASRAVKLRQPHRATR